MQTGGNGKHLKLFFVLKVGRDNFFANSFVELVPLGLECGLFIWPSDTTACISFFLNIFNGNQNMSIGRQLWRVKIFIVCFIVCIQFNIIVLFAQLRKYKGGKMNWIISKQVFYANNSKKNQVVLPWQFYSIARVQKCWLKQS